MHEWEFGTLNVRSGKEKLEGARMYMITKEVARAKLSFCCLQEVRHRKSGKKIIQLDTGEKYSFLWCGYKKRRMAGVGILIKLEPGITYDEPDFNDPRIMAVNMIIHGFKIRVVSCYSPTNVSESESAKDDFYRKLKTSCNSCPKNYKLIVTGDFNAETSIVYRKTNFDCTNFMEDELCNNNGQRLKSFARHFKLSFAQSFFEHSMPKRYTWYSCDGITKKILDYVLNQRFINQYITNCCVRAEFEFNSDHALLVTSLVTPKDKKSRWKKRQKPFRKPDAKLLRETKYMEQYAKQCTDDLKQHENNCNSVDEISEKLKQTLTTAASNILPVKSPTKTNEIWKDDEILNGLLRERTEKTKSSNEKIILTRKIKRRVLALRNKKLLNEANELNDFSTKREIEVMYKSFKNDGSSFKPIKENNKCDKQKLQEYFSSHFGSPKDDPDPIELVNAPEFLHGLRNVPVNFSSLPPSKSEIIHTLKNMKNGKASNDLPAEYLKYAIDSIEVIEELHKLYKLVWQTQLIPTKWRHSKLITIWKGPSKGKADDPTAYRGIQIGSTFCKLLVIMILERTRNWYEEQLLDNQQGFRSGRGTSDAIYIVKRMQQISHLAKNPSHLLFVDLSAAFDHVNREWLFKSLKQRFPNQESDKLIQLLEALYSYTTTSLQECETNIFELFVGVRQGGAESPSLYNLYMDFVMRIFMHECSLKRIKFSEFNYMIPRSATKENKFELGHIGKRSVSWVGYADDIVLAFKSVLDLRKGLEVLNNVFKRYQLNINASKTKTMIFAFPQDDNDYPETICSLDGKKIDNVKIFKYLGANIHFRESATGDTEINQRIESAECKFYEHAKKFMNFKINLTTRVRILNSLVRSRLTYGSQTWNINSAQQTRINGFYCGLLRRMVRGGYRRKDGSMALVYTNDAIYGMCKTPKIASYIENLQQKFLAHIIRRDDQSIIKQLTFNDDRARQRGRQNSTLRKQVLSRSGCSPNEFYIKSKNRVI